MTDPRSSFRASCAAALAAALASHAPAAAEGPSAAYRVETVAEGLDHPWSLAFLPDGAMLVTERPGRLRRIADGKLDPEPIAGVPPVYAANQGGLFDVVLDPAFAETGRLYLSYAHGTRKANATRLARATLEGGALKELDVIFTASPEKSTSLHFGGRIGVLPDGTLLLTLGDGYRYRERAQRLEDNFGATIRIKPDGSLPPDNPFMNHKGARPEIFTYGHRNVQGLAIDKATGRIWTHEHGARGGDELNLLAPGRNYGWPLATTGVDYSGAMITPFKTYEGTEPFVIDWTPSIAPSGLALYEGEAFPAWKGDLFVGALAGRHVRRVDLDADGKVLGQEELFGELGERIRDVRAGPDGALYLLTDSDAGRVLRVVPAR